MVEVAIFSTKKQLTMQVWNWQNKIVHCCKIEESCLPVQERELMMKATVIKKSFSIYCLWKADYPIKTNEETSVLAQ
jgi:hypothetical protein